MNKVLVTGVNGFVGQHLAKELADNDIKTVGVGGAHGLKDITATLESYQELDLSKSEEAEKINFKEIDGVIHLAGLAAVGPSFENPMLYLNVNIGIEINLFETALKQGVKPRVLIISSGTLYDPKAPLPLSEESPVDPNSPYAVSKLGQEQMAQYYNTRGFECIIARPFNHIGPGQGPGFIVPDFAQQIVKCERGEQSEIKVGNLDAKRDFTDVRDIVRAYRLMLEKGTTGATFNVCSGKAISGHEILEGLLVAAKTNPGVTQDPDKMRPSDTPILYGEHKKLTEATGWKPEISLERTLADVIADWRNR